VPSLIKLIAAQLVLGLVLGVGGYLLGYAAVMVFHDIGKFFLSVSVDVLQM